MSDATLSLLARMVALSSELAAMQQPGNDIETLKRNIELLTASHKILDAADLLRAK